jgi:hypothetical protein
MIVIFARVRLVPMKQLLRVLPIAVAAALLVPAFTPTVSYASPVDAQRGRVEDIVDELERLEENARRIGEEYVLAVDAKAVLDSEIVESEARVAAKESEIGELRGDLGEMAIRSFVGAGSTPLGPLFEDTSDLNAIMQRDELARVALSAGTVTTDELNAIVADLEEAASEHRPSNSPRISQTLKFAPTSSLPNTPRLAPTPKPSSARSSKRKKRAALLKLRPVFAPNMKRKLLQRTQPLLQQRTVITLAGLRRLLRMGAAPAWYRPTAVATATRAVARRQRRLPRLLLRFHHVRARP